MLELKIKKISIITLTNREIFDLILEQALDYILSEKETFYDKSRFEQLQLAILEKDPLMLELKIKKISIKH